MGFTYGDVLKLLRREFDADEKIFSSTPTQQTGDDGFDVVVVDLMSVMFSLLHGCSSADELKRRLGAMIYQHAALGASVTVFCVDDKTHVPAAKGCEWRSRSEQSSFVRPYETHVECFDGRSVPIDTYQFGVHALPDNAHRMKKTPALMRGFLRYLTGLIAHELQLAHVAAKNEHLTAYTVFTCGHRFLEPDDSADDEDDEASVGTIKAVHSFRSEPAAAKPAFRPPAETDGYDNGDDELAAPTPEAVAAQRVHVDVTTVQLKVLIGEGELKAVHWAVERLLRRQKCKRVLVHANDGDGLASALLAWPRLQTQKHSPVLIMTLCQRYVVPMKRALTLRECNARLEKETHKKTAEALGKTAKQLKLDARANHKTSDVGALHAAITRKLEAKLTSPVHTVVALLMFGGNDYVDNLKGISVGTLWPQFMRALAADRFPSDALVVVPQRNRLLDLQYNEDAWLEFVLASALSSSKKLEAANDALFVDKLQDFVPLPSRLPLAARFALVSEAAGSLFAAAAGTATKPAALRIPVLGAYQRMRAWLRRVMWSLDYYGNATCDPPAACDPLTQAGDVSLYGYLPPSADAYCEFAPVVAKSEDILRQPFHAGARSGDTVNVFVASLGGAAPDPDRTVDAWREHYAEQVRRDRLAVVNELNELQASPAGEDDDAPLLVRRHKNPLDSIWDEQSLKKRSKSTPAAELYDPQKPVPGSELSLSQTRTPGASVSSDTWTRLAVARADV